MKTTLVASIVCLFFLAAQPVLSQAQVTRSPEAVALLAQCAATMGAAQLQDVQAEGTVTRADGREPARSLLVKSKGADRVRNEITAADRQETYVVNRGRGHELRGETRKALPAHAIGYHRPEHIPAFACQVDLGRSQMEAVFVGVEAVRGRAAYHIKFVAAARGDADDGLEALLSEFHVFLDGETLVVLKTWNYVFAPDAIENHSRWELYYSDYRNVGGVMMPFRIERYDNDQKLEEVVFSRVLTNVGIADSEFE
ncbi:MAG: hypothetical protein ACRD2Q_08660 [Terriglobales bacterium]